MSMVHASRGKLPPASEHLRSEPAIVAGIARATLPDSKVAWADLIADYDRIRDKIEAVFPDFKDFNERIRHPGGFRLPLPPTERVWNTASGKAEFLRLSGAEGGSDGDRRRRAPAHHDPQPRPVQHHDLWRWTTAIAASSAGATCCS